MLLAFAALTNLHIVLLSVSGILQSRANSVLNCNPLCPLPPGPLRGTSISTKRVPLILLGTVGWICQAQSYRGALSGACVVELDPLKLSCPQ